MKSTGLVLEGGGMRGVYTVGVLDYFMERNLYFPYVIGVSAGACNAASYVSKQKGRNKTIDIDYIKDPRYLSLRNFFKEKSIFGMKFLFEDIPNNIVPFDFETFNDSKQKFFIGTTDCETGKSVYFEKSDCSDPNEIIMASSSLPFASQPVKIGNHTLLDGGISDPIPVKKAFADGNSKVVIVLTRNEGYKKEPFKHRLFAKKIYPQYEKLVDAMLNRHKIYNETLDYIKNLEEKGLAFVIRPQDPIKVRRIEKDSKRLTDLYNEGYEDAKACYEDMLKWMNRE